jgi:hypothetical protein
VEVQIENRATRIDTRRANERNWLVRARDSLSAAEENAKRLSVSLGARTPNFNQQRAAKGNARNSFFAGVAFISPIHFCSLRLFILRAPLTNK